MKKLNRFAVVALGFLTLTSSLTSCLSDSDNKNEITKEQAIAAVKAMKGTYTGKVTSTLGNTQTTETTPNQTWESDVKLKIPAFRVAPIASTLDNTYADLRQALDDKKTVECTAQYSIVKLESGVTYFGLYPDNIEFDVTYGGNKHRVALAFAQAQYGGTFMTASKNMAFSMVVSNLYLDNKRISTFPQVLYTYRTK